MLGLQPFEAAVVSYLRQQGGHAGRCGSYPDGETVFVERVTAQSTVEELTRQRERVERWPKDPTRERVLEALDEWIAQKTLAPNAPFAPRITSI
jgi:hypothetical protein